MRLVWKFNSAWSLGTCCEYMNVILVPAHNMYMQLSPKVVLGSNKLALSFFALRNSNTGTWTCIAALFSTWKYARPDPQWNISPREDLLKITRAQLLTTWRFSNLTCETLSLQRIDFDWTEFREGFRIDSTQSLHQ